MEINLKCLILGILFLDIPLAYCTYPAYYIEDNCVFGNEVLIYNATRYGDVGTLVVTSRPPYQPNKNCKIIIEPPPGFGVVVSIRKIDFRQPSFFCLDYLKIYHSDALFSPTTLCRFKFDLNEKTSYYSRGRMEMLYHVESKLSDGLGIEEGFTLIFTVVTEELKDCLDANNFFCNNGRCIPNFLTCDIHNNCGDYSDEDKFLCDVPPVHYFQVTDVLYVVAICLFILLMVSSCVILVQRRRRRILDSDSASDSDESTTRTAPYQTVHPSRYFICQNPAGPATHYTQHLKNVPCEGGFSNPCYPSGVPQAPPPYSQ